MRFSHTLLITFYALLPIAAAIGTFIHCRRQHSFKPVSALIISAFSSIVISLTICLIYARITSATATVGQVLLLAYFLLGVLSLLKLMSWGLKEGAERLFHVHRNQTIGPHGLGWAVRLAGATLTRVVLLFTIGLPYIMSLGMVYRPKVSGGETPTQQLNIPYEDVSFHSTDGISLSGWWVPARPASPRQQNKTTQPSVSVNPTNAAENEKPADAVPALPADLSDWGKKTAIICHGLGAGKSNQFLLSRDLIHNGYNVLIFDFRAHGDSGGQLSSFGDLERKDVLGAIRWLKANRPQESQKIVGLGVSMGAAALLSAAAEPTEEGRALDAVAVISTYDKFATLADDITDNYFIPPVGWLARYVGVPLASLHVGTNLRSFSPIEAVDQLAPRPLMVVHGRDDHIIPFDNGVRLFEGAQVPKIRLWVGELNANHQYVIRANAKYRNDAQGTPKFQPPEGLPADHNNVLYYDDAMKAITLFFESARATL